jgi:plasmid stabilization system protein ParE
MEYRVKVMPRAERDLAGIYDWIGAHSSEAALAWYQGLKHAIRTLRSSPNRCPVAPEDRNLRHLLYGSKPHIYRVIYRILEKQKQVDVLHVRHGARQEFKAGELLCPPVPDHAEER